MSPGVTAIVPTHNRPEMMKRAVQSVIDQDYDGEIEVIVVFDACPPVLPDVVLAPNRTLRGLENERSRGLAGARNTGILSASHSLVAFLDDDDYWLPEKLARQVPVLERHGDAVLVGTGMLADDGKRTYERLVPHDPVRHPHLIRNRLVGLHSSGFLLRRTELLERVGLIDEELPRSYCEDYDILLRVAEGAPIPVANEALIVVTWQGQSHFVGQWEAYGDALERLLVKHPAFGEVRSAAARIEAQVAFARAASGQRRESLRWIRRSLGHDPRQTKAWLALVVALRLVSAPRLTRWVARLGRGI